MKPPTPTPHPAGSASSCVCLSHKYVVSRSHTCGQVCQGSLALGACVVGERVGGDDNLWRLPAHRLRPGRTPPPAGHHPHRHVQTHTHTDLGPNTPSCIPSSELALCAPKCADRTNTSKARRLDGRPMPRQAGRTCVVACPVAGSASAGPAGPLHAPTHPPGQPPQTAGQQRHRTARGVVSKQLLLVHSVTQGLCSSRCCVSHHCQFPHPTPFPTLSPPPPPPTHHHHHTTAPPTHLQRVTTHTAAPPQHPPAHQAPHHPPPTRPQSCLNVQG